MVFVGLTQMQMVIEWPLQPSQSIYTQLLGVTLRVEFDLVMLCTQGTCNPILGKLRVVVGYYTLSSLRSLGADLFGKPVVFV